ncbi:MAG TPA: thiol:disulfide interchange protein DsbA/DsbL [Steroidobacteraceae bacterium]|jgi:thiol:disulfide interchange protein DsbA|nr:thiol:disulfide interchange protein DsbA/DsbL [Steroidobacteraceae bacterium]
MLRPLLIAVALSLCACGQQPATPPTQASAPAPSAAPPPPATPAASNQTETEQARRSQETGADNDHPARSDVSLEQMARLPASAQLPEGRWKAGTNYQPVVPAQSTSVAPGKVEVMEVFWLGCPHCFVLEPHMLEWLKKKPAYVEFLRVHVMWDSVKQAHAKLYYTLEALGRDDLFEKAFATVQQQGTPLVGNNDDQNLRVQQAFAVQNGVSADDFAKAYNSFSVNSNLARALEITQRYHVEHVPFVIINGKYTTDVNEAGGETQLLALINDLAAAEHHQ